MIAEEQEAIRNWLHRAWPDQFRVEHRTACAICRLCGWRISNNNQAKENHRRIHLRDYLGLLGEIWAQQQRTCAAMRAIAARQQRQRFEIKAEQLAIRLRWFAPAPATRTAPPTTGPFAGMGDLVPE